MLNDAVLPCIGVASARILIVHASSFWLINKKFSGSAVRRINAVENAARKKKRNVTRFTVES